MVAPSPQGQGNGREREPVRYLVFSGSLREESLNSRLAAWPPRRSARTAVEVDLASMRDFDCPSYDGDVEKADGIPAGAEELQRRLEATDAFILSSPEYNASMPGVLKNAIDWVSRFRPQPFDGDTGCCSPPRPRWSAAIAGCGRCASRSSISARASTRTCSRWRRRTRPSTSDGRIANAQLQERFDANVAAFMDLVEAAKHYPCVKRAWVEFLGEHPDPAFDRVE